MSIFRKTLAVAAFALLVAGLTPAGADSLLFEPTYENGDWNGDGARDVSDVVGMARWLFLGGAGPVELDCVFQGSSFSQPLGVHCDVNGDLVIDVSDVAYTVNFLFLGGPEPVIIPCDQYGL